MEIDYNDLARSVSLGKVVAKLLNESVRGVERTVVRKGKLKTKLDCPKGYKSTSNGCEKMSQSDIIKFTKRARRSALTRKRHAGVNKKSMLKSLKFSKKIRNKNQARVNRTKYL